ncbi:hypothetical protein GCM10020367_64530 [Streptomyces sannanensis]|uniref:DUF1876 domain-containing protein n=1 Tax=Streptomyces sannanensis TaxID=285536 RepID=A0ABP6S4D8_9ACTN
MTGTAEDERRATKEWKPALSLFREGSGTVARVVLDTGDILQGHAEAHDSPQDGPVPEIGDELTAERALVSLGQCLIRAAAADIEDMESDHWENSAWWTP